MSKSQDDRRQCGRPGAQCPCCGAGWSPPFDVDNSLEWIDRQSAKWLAELKSAKFADMVRGHCYEVVFLPGEDNNGKREMIIDGNRCEYQRAWLFSCPLCGAEESLPFGYWERSL